MRLHHVRLLVQDVGESIRFYRDVLGLDLTWGEEGIGYASFSGGDGIGLSVFLRTGQPEAETGGRGDTVLLSMEVHDVDGEVERLRALGVAPVGGPRTEDGWGLRVAYVRDPDGNLVELMRQLPRDDWSAWLRDADRRYT